MSVTGCLWILLSLVGTSAVPSAEGELECACRLRTQRDSEVNVTCSNTQGDSSEIYCVRGDPEAGRPPAPRYVRDDFLFLSGRSMVYFSRTGNSWDGARDSCRLIGADLFVPRDDASLQLLRRQPFYGLFRDSEVFIGVNDTQWEGHFVDLEGKPVEHLQWRPGEPNNAGNNEDCAAWNREGGANDRACSLPLQYLCEWWLRSEPPAGYTFVGATGSFVRLSDDRQPYEAAVGACASQGAALFVPDTVARVEALLRYVPVDIGDMLVGLTDRGSDGVFRTATGARLSDMEFQGWLPGQPDDGGSAAGSEGEDCVVLHSHGFLADVSCAAPQRYVCEWAP